jgi:hypothetical protein
MGTNNIKSVVTELGKLQLREKRARKKVHDKGLSDTDLMCRLASLKSCNRPIPPHLMQKLTEHMNRCKKRWSKQKQEELDWLLE